MLILLAIFLLLFIPLVMLFFYLLRLKFGIQGFLAVLATLSGWIIVLVARRDVPGAITLLQWQPSISFLDPPTLLTDDVSWYLALAIITLGLSSILTSIARLGQSKSSDSSLSEGKNEVIEVYEQAEQATSPGKPFIINKDQSTSRWQSWAGISIMTGLGLVAVTAGNMLTILLAWAALDIFELFILLSQVSANKTKKRVILAFSLRMAALGIVLLGGIYAWSHDMSLAFNAIDKTMGIYLILAAGLRLGTLFIQLPFDYFSQRREFETILRLVPAAASFILVVRVAAIGISGSLGFILLGFVILVGLYASIRWLFFEDQNQGLQSWVLGAASLSIASAILMHPSGSIAWSIASLLCGGLVFSLFLQSKALIPIALLGFIGFSALPFSPTWMGTDFYGMPGIPSSTVPQYAITLLSLAFLLVHVFLLAGFICYISRAIPPRVEITKVHVERWVWLLYPVGLMFLLVTHFLTGVLLNLKIKEFPITGWVMGVVAVILSGLIWYFYTRFIRGYTPVKQKTTAPSLSKIFSFEASFNFFGNLFHSLARLFALISTILEGDGGILWAFVLFALIFVFLLR